MNIEEGHRIKLGDSCHMVLNCTIVFRKIEKTSLVSSDNVQKPSREITNPGGSVGPQEKNKPHHNNTMVSNVLSLLWFVCEILSLPSSYQSTAKTFLTYYTIVIFLI